jgi:hypothetical protein
MFDNEHIAKRGDEVMFSFSKFKLLLAILVLFFCCDKLQAPVMGAMGEPIPGAEIYVELMVLMVFLSATG